jgi:hypothetical protein
LKVRASNYLCSGGQFCGFKIATSQARKTLGVIVKHFFQTI